MEYGNIFAKESQQARTNDVIEVKRRIFAKNLSEYR